MKHKGRILLLLVAFVALTARNAHAYLDPGTGSYVLQLVIAFFVGAVFAVKMFWRRIGAFFLNLFSRKPREPR